MSKALPSTLIEKMSLEQNFLGLFGFSSLARSAPCNLLIHNYWGPSHSLQNEIIDSSNARNNNIEKESPLPYFRSFFTLQSVPMANIIPELVQCFGRSVTDQTSHWSKEYFHINDFILTQYSVIKKQSQHDIHVLNIAWRSWNILDHCPDHSKFCIQDAICAFNAFYVKRTTIRGINHSVLPALGPFRLWSIPTLATERNVPRQKILVCPPPKIANSPSFVHHSVDKYKSQVSVSPSPPDVELTPKRRAEIKWKRVFSVLKYEAVEGVNLAWLHYFHTIWSNWSPKGGHVHNKTPISPKGSFLDGARSTMSGSEQFRKNELSEGPYLPKRSFDRRGDVLTTHSSIFAAHGMTRCTAIASLWCLPYTFVSSCLNRLELEPNTLSLTDYRLCHFLPSWDNWQGIIHSWLHFEVYHVSCSR